MSNYKKKQKGKPAAAVKVVKKKDVPPVFDYICECHSLPAKKKALVIDRDTEFKDRNKIEHSLGTWNCSITRSKCKVSRRKHKGGGSALTTQEAAEAIGIFSDKELPAVQSNAELLQELGIQ